MAPRIPKIKQVLPACSVEGGRVWIEGSGFDAEELASTLITFGGIAARPWIVSSKRILTQVPEDATSGPLVISVKGKRGAEFPYEIGTRLSNEVNPVDSPIFDREGNLYVCYSGKRGETPPVSVYKISPSGEIYPHLSNIPNATSLALDQENNLYVSSRFEGTIYKCTPSADATLFARDLGTPTGLAFDKESFLYCGDRAGRILKISPEGEVKVFAEVPESMILFHIAIDLDGNLLVTNPGLSSSNSIFVVNPLGKPVALYSGFGRPQGLTVDSRGNIYICESKAGDSAVYRISRDGAMVPIIGGNSLLGIALDNAGNVAVVSQSSVYKLKLPA